MSKAWHGGSTRRWRTTRRLVLDRDNHLCRLKLKGCTVRATQVHHTGGKATGDDSSALVAACAWCNQSTGDPSRHNPRPNPRTKW